jgi:hypothetical protein
MLLGLRRICGISLPLTGAKWCLLILPDSPGSMLRCLSSGSAVSALLQAPWPDCAILAGAGCGTCPAAAREDEAAHPNTELGEGLTGINIGHPELGRLPVISALLSYPEGSPERQGRPVGGGGKQVRLTRWTAPKCGSGPGRTASRSRTAAGCPKTSWPVTSKATGCARPRYLAQMCGLATACISVPADRYATGPHRRTRPSWRRRGSIPTRSW